MVQGDYKIELKFVDERVFLNYWDSIHGNDVCCQVKDGKLFKFVHSPTSVESDQLKDEPEIDDVFEMVEVSLIEFIDLVKMAVAE